MSKSNNLGGFDPLAPGNAVPSSTAPPFLSHPPLDARQLQFLQQQGFSSGLIRALSTHAFPLRIWILDNSGAMNVNDSHRISGTTFDNLQNLPVTRWEELQDCVAYHSQMAALFAFPTRFALLNPPTVGPQYFSVAEHGPSFVAQEMQTVQHVMTHTRPAGPCPLTEQIAGLQKYISSIAPRLRQQQSTVSVILTTQGIPTSPHFIPTLRSLEGLPVWVVLRLCTDDETVFDFYNSLDAQMNLPYDVLDDFFGEALEVYLRNPWLTYGLPLHRFRESGIRIDVLDEIDEQALTLRQVRDLCSVLFSSPTVLPDPAVDWNAFFQALSTVMAREKPQWNPVTRKLSPWINLIDLNRLYGTPRQPQYPQQYSQPQYPQHPFSQPQQQQPPTLPTYQQSPSSYYQPPPPPNYHQSPPPMAYQQSPRPPTYQQQHPPPPPNVHQQPQPQPQGTRPQPTQQGQTPPVPTNENTVATLKGDILKTWALQPPTLQQLRPIHHLLGTVQTTFPPAFGVEPHAYFSKWKPLSPDALSSGQEAVLKRAVRKMKFFLHPDKLPHDFSEKQALVCKLIWDVTADAMEAENK